VPENVSNVPVWFVWAAVLFGLLALAGGGFKLGPFHMHRTLGGRERWLAGFASVSLFAAALLTVVIGPATTLLDHRPVDPNSLGGRGVVTAEAQPTPNEPTSSPRASRANISGVTSVSRVIIGRGGQEAVRGAAGDLGALADSAHITCQRAADLQISTRLAAEEAVLWEASNREEARSMAEGFQSRLRDAGFDPDNWSANTLEGSFHSYRGGIRGAMWSSDDGLAWMWIACRIVAK